MSSVISGVRIPEPVPFSTTSKVEYLCPLAHSLLRVTLFPEERVDSTLLVSQLHVGHSIDIIDVVKRWLHVEGIAQLLLTAKCGRHQNLQ